MKENIKKYIIPTIIIFMAIVSIASCSDREEVEISYGENIGISAAHIFDNYEPFIDGDFDMSIDNWKLNLQVLIYDNTGTLIDNAEKLCNNLRETLEYTPKLNPGEYTVVSIADFREGLGGSGYKFWEISHKENIQDLSITENLNIYPVVFETLGIDIQNFTISNKPTSLKVDIKPITSLLLVYSSDGDYSDRGLNGYSRFVALTDGYFVRALKFQNNIRFENNEPKYKYSEQLSDYNISISETHDKWENRKAATTYQYRALLPEEDKGFNFHIQKRDLPEEYYNSFVEYCGEFETDGLSNKLPMMESNKQYVLNMVFDAMQLTFFEMPKNYQHESYTKQFVSDYNKQLVSDMIKRRYENLLTKNLNFCNVFINNSPRSYNELSSLYVAYYPRSTADMFEQFINVGFLDPNYECCAMIDILLPNLNQELVEYTKNILSESYNPEEEGKYGKDAFTYLGKNKDETNSPYRVVLQRNYNTDLDVYNWFLMYILRNDFYPDEYKNTGNNGNDNGDNENNGDNSDDKSPINQIFAYDWNSFVNQDVNIAIAAIGPNFSTEGNLIWYYNFNEMVSKVCLSMIGDQVKFVYVYVNSPDSETDTMILDYLNTKFYPTNKENKFIDSENFMNYNMMITYENGIISYAGR